MSRPAFLRDRRTELTLGLLAFAVGSWLIYDAYEARGRTRPFGMHLLP